jgi:hypothetical protein
LMEIDILVRNTLQELLSWDLQILSFSILNFSLAQDKEQDWLSRVHKI